jgi:hypothetical protein
MRNGAPGASTYSSNEVSRWEPVLACKPPGRTSSRSRIIVGAPGGRQPSEAIPQMPRELNHLGPFVDVFGNELVLSLTAALGASSFSRAPGVEINCMTCSMSSCTP